MTSSWSTWDDWIAAVKDECTLQGVDYYTLASTFSFKEAYDFGQKPREAILEARDPQEGCAPQLKAAVKALQASRCYIEDDLLCLDKPERKIIIDFIDQALSTLRGGG